MRHARQNLTVDADGSRRLHVDGLTETAGLGADLPVQRGGVLFGADLLIAYCRDGGAEARAEHVADAPDRETRDQKTKQHFGDPCFDAAAQEIEHRQTLLSGEARGHYSAAAAGSSDRLRSGARAVSASQRTTGTATPSPASFSACVSDFGKM